MEGLPWRSHLQNWGRELCSCSSMSPARVGLVPTHGVLAVMLVNKRGDSSCYLPSPLLEVLESRCWLWPTSTDFGGCKHLLALEGGSSVGQAGPSLRQKLSDFPVEEKEKLAEAEIRILQKQFRIVAEKRKSYIANMRHKIQAQEKEIKSLTEEHQKESLMLSQLISLRNEMLDDKICMELQCLLQTKYQYDSLIRDRKALLADLNNQILELEKKVVRQNQIAVNVKQVNCSKRLQKKIEALETHLNNVTVHFNTILTGNNKLQEEIENLRTQKAVLDNSYMKLHKKLDQQMRRMNAAIEQSAQAHKQWMDSLAKISAMKEQHNKDTVHFNTEMRERKRVLVQNAQVKNFMLTKSRNRSEMEKQAKEKKALKVAQRVKQRQSVSHEVAYRRLMELAEDGDIDRLVNGFIEREGKNLSCFSYATKLSSEMNKIHQKIEDLQNEITAIVMDRERAESSNLRILKELEEKLTETTEETRRYEERCKKSSKVLGQLKSDVEDLCKENNCDATKIRQQLRENKQIMELNLTQFSGLVEKTKELLLLESILRYTSAEAELLGEPFVSPLLGSTEHLQATDQARLCPLPPTLDGTTDATEALEVPLDHSQLCQLVHQSQGKKQERHHQHRKEEEWC
ncbi:coiled-coil domain-containing protein 63 [Athene cunicularia]|uniref:coiled-coil domain-containing protein 63 n=1 Tax=Athene cunicularia TaxID=194338 RepID=UPI000EF7566B|nr:coiled-coil domain-containing protein 63 [Athene cunicularia]